MQDASGNNSEKFNKYVVQLQNFYGNKLNKTQLEKVAKFRERGLPPIITKDSLAWFLGLSTQFISNLETDIPAQYRDFSISKKDGSTRSINTPKLGLKVIQWWILENILRKISLEPNIFGFVRGKSIRDNADYHKGAKHILTVDLENFFPSITIKKVLTIFQSLDYDYEVAKMLANLCCHKDSISNTPAKLPQGAPTSPAISNIVSRAMDEELGKLAKNINCKYSRYADDMTFSSNQKIDSNVILEVSKIIKRHGFNLNRQKTRFFGQGDQIKITGLVINEKIQPSRVWRKKVRCILHYLEKQDQISFKDLNRLNGLKGSSMQFADCIQMKRIVESINHILSKHKHGKDVIFRKPDMPENLTVNQAITLTLISSCDTNKEIATELNITESAVESRLSAAYKKIGAKSRQDAVEWIKNNTGKLLYKLRYEVRPSLRSK